MEYVWGLHPFTPEHEDEIEFKAGERILVTEKDDIYQDGWWRGTNHAGKNGLFPQAYTTNVPPASVAVSTPSKLVGTLSALEEDEDEGESSHGHDDHQQQSRIPVIVEPKPVPAASAPGATSSLLENDPASEPATTSEPQASTSGTVLHATMTDIQEAIEQLGVRHDSADTASRSFSFASTKEGDTTDEEGLSDGEHGEYGAGWSKGARQLLAANAAKQQQEQQQRNAAKAHMSASFPAPPIDVEMSDESEDEHPLGLHHAITDHRDSVLSTGSYDAVRAFDDASAATAEAIEAQKRVAEEVPPTPVTARPYSFGVNGNGHPGGLSVSTSNNARDDGDATTIGGSTPRKTKLSESTVVGVGLPHASSREQLQAAVPILPAPVDVEEPKPEAEDDAVPAVPASTSLAVAQTIPLPMSSPASPAPIPTIDSVVRTASPLQMPESTAVAPTLVPAPAPAFIPLTEPVPAPAPVAAPAPVSAPVPVPTSAPAPAPAPAAADGRSPNPPSEWTVEEVVAWLRSKKFDDSVTSKFIEHDITGDVLLELDANMLKEVDITALGKRMRIANAIAELRRPPSVVSYNPPTSSFGASTAASRVGVEDAMSMSTGIGMGMPSSLNHSQAQAVPYSPESAPHTGDILGTPLSSNVFTGFADARNGRARPASLALGPDDANVAGRGMLTAVSTTSTSLSAGQLHPPPSELGGREESTVVAETETVSSNTRTGRKGFGRSAQNSISSIASLVNSAALPASSTDPIRLKHQSKDSSMDSKSSPSTPISPDDVGAKGSVKEKESSRDKGKSGTTLRTSTSDSAGSGSRHSFFGGGSKGKSRKPAPRYSETLETLENIAKPSRSISRLYLTGNSHKRGRLSQSTPPSSGAFSTESGGSSEHHGDQSSPHAVRELSHASPITLSSSTGIEVGADGGMANLRPNVSVLEQIGTPDREGWMRKKGERYNTWKLRYFFLKGPHLYYLRSKTETKIKGYINIKGYRIMADENANPGRYGFRIVHETGVTHWFSSDEQIAVREWMKSLMKATIARDYAKPVMSSVNIPTIPLAVAQAMSPAPRPPSPTQRDATQRALRRENPNQLSSRDAHVLMGLPTENGAAPPSNAPVASSAVIHDGPTTPVLTTIPTPNRPQRDSARPDNRGRNRALEQALDAELIAWINKHIPHSSRKATDMSTSLTTGLVLYRLAESIKTSGASDKGLRGDSGVPEVPDGVFSTGPDDERLDGLFVLFDFLLDNDVRIGNVTINDVRSGDRDQLVVLVKALRSWEEKRNSMDGMIARQPASVGPFLG